MAGCANCKSKSECLNCDGGYFLDLTKKCQKCSIDNCIVCKNNVSTPQCTTCTGDKYVEVNATW